MHQGAVAHEAILFSLTLNYSIVKSEQFYNKIRKQNETISHVNNYSNEGELKNSSR